MQSETFQGAMESLSWFMPEKAISQADSFVLRVVIQSTWAYYRKERDLFGANNGIGAIAPICYSWSNPLGATSIYCTINIKLDITPIEIFGFYIWAIKMGGVSSMQFFLSWQKT